MFEVIPFLSYVFVTTFTPGPNNIMAMSISGRYGWKKTLRFTLGVFSGFALVLMLCAFANLLLYRVIPRIQLAMNIIGAAYMAYLAYKILMSSTHAHSSEMDSSQFDRQNSFWGGFALQFVNAKGILYGITVMANFVIPYFKSSISLILFSLGMAFTCFLANNSWAFLGSLFQRFLTKYEKIFNVVMALLLLYCAVSLFTH